jgi:hypothetical protein
MARPRRTKLQEDRLSDGSVVFWADVTVAVGDRRHITIGHSREGIDRATALRKLRQEELKIAAGQWVDPRPAEPTGAEITFQQYASEWFAAKSREVEKRTVDDLRWRLTKHLIPFFGAYQLAAIDKQLVKKFREFKLAERDALAERISAGERPRDERGQPLKPLSNTSINKLLGTTSAIFDEAVEEDELLDTNPVPKKRLKQPPPKRTWLMPDELLDLIEAAERVDQRHKPETIERAREVQAVLAAGGTLADAPRRSCGRTRRPCASRRSISSTATRARGARSSPCSVWPARVHRSAARSTSATWTSPTAASRSAERRPTPPSARPGSSTSYAMSSCATSTRLGCRPRTGRFIQRPRANDARRTTCASASFPRWCARQIVCAANAAPPQSQRRSRRIRSGARSFRSSSPTGAMCHSYSARPATETHA